VPATATAAAAAAQKGLGAIRQSAPEPTYTWHRPIAPHTGQHPAALPSTTLHAAAVGTVSCLASGGGWLLQSGQPVHPLRAAATRATRADTSCSLGESIRHYSSSLMVVCWVVALPSCPPGVGSIGGPVQQNHQYPHLRGNWQCHRHGSHSSLQPQVSLLVVVMVVVLGWVVAPPGAPQVLLDVASPWTMTPQPATPKGQPAMPP
jgi:hypothetical protein